MGLCSALLAVLAALSHAAVPARFDFYDRGPYREGVPRPAQVLGYGPGTFHTSYGNLERYVDALLQAAPDRASRESFGRTYEFRERALLILTSPENQRRLAAVREASAKLADPRRLGSSAEAEKLVETTPVTVWLNYSIHGDESASFEAMMQVAYQLAAGQDSTTQAILERCVVLLNLAHNPDGHERFVTWVNALGSGNPDPWAIEQQGQQPWGIGGRTNHYQLDMNRDALAMSQLESRQMAQAYRRWRPQVLVDHHGQTASYFFPPTAEPMNPVLPSAEVEKWNEVFGRANAQAFDRYGWNYYVRDIFDFFYPGYWDIWPTLQGTVGMTYETDGGGNLAIRRDDETVVTLLDGIERHFTASLTTCAAAAAHREERLRDFARFAREAVAMGRSGPVHGYAIDVARDPLGAAALAENLLNAGVEVMWVGGAFRAAARPVWWDAPVTHAPANLSTGGASSAARKDGAVRPTAAARGGMASYPEAPWAPHAFREGAFVVDLAQPASRVARTLLERDATLQASFARTQLEKYERNIRRGKNARRETYDFYDVTAWSLPLAYGVEAFAVRDISPRGSVLAPIDPDIADEGEDTIPDSLAVGVPLTARASRAGPLVLRDARGRIILDLRGRVEGGRAATAYVWAYDGEGAARLALRLLAEDFKVAAATKPLRAGGRSLPRGSFVARVERNPERLHERIETLARSCGVRVLALNTAYTDQGDTGIGSESVVSLKRPRIGILTDSPVSPTSYGWLWFLFERRLGLKFTALRSDALRGSEIDRYNVLVVPDGNGSELAAALGEGGIERVKQWVDRGGVLLCLDDAAEFPTLKSVGLSSARVVGVKEKPKDEGEVEKDEAGKEKDAAADSLAREADRRPEPLPGTVFRASLDPRHFLCYGFDGAHLPVLLQGRLFLKPSKEGANPLLFDGSPLGVSGWTWPETERRLMGTAYAVDEPRGDGHVLMITGAPAFRLFWRSTERLVLNAVLFGPALD
jgi:hypothetical protein